jgi:hypothetical protein
LDKSSSGGSIWFGFIFLYSFFFIYFIPSSLFVLFEVMEKIVERMRCWYAPGWPGRNTPRGTALDLMSQLMMMVLYEIDALLHSFEIFDAVIHSRSNSELLEKKGMEKLFSYKLLALTGRLRL